MTGDIAAVLGKDPSFGMLVVPGLPPIVDRIWQAFPFAKGRPILYCWGHTIYSSNGAVCGPEKMAHEAVHAARQGDDVEGWWERYMVDSAFRLAEELPAHVAEYLILCEMDSGRGARRRALRAVAGALASPLYGGLLSLEKAKRLILDGASAVKTQEGL